jgi:hypothetical protein
MYHPTVRHLGRKACVVHEIDADSIDLMKAYSDRELKVIDSRPEDDVYTPSDIDALQPHIERVREWRILPNQIALARKALEDRRIEVANNTRAKAIRRPIAGLERTALDLILDGDWQEYTELKTKTNQENLARAAREAVLAIRAHVPEAARPVRGGGAALRDLHRLYSSLSVLDDYGSLVGDSDFS